MFPQLIPVSVSCHQHCLTQKETWIRVLQISSGSMGRGLGSQDHLAGLPRNFSLSDLGLDHVMDGENGGMMPRNISLSDFPALDLDSGGEQS